MKLVGDYNPGIEELLVNLRSFSFDIFLLKILSNGRELFIIAHEIVK